MNSLSDVKADNGLVMLCRVAVGYRKVGASLRALAPLFGVSKSTLHRWWPAVESIAASHLGQREEQTNENGCLSGGRLSQAGQS